MKAEIVKTDHRASKILKSLIDAVPSR